jgi:hypothetical protein
MIKVTPDLLKAGFAPVAPCNDKSLSMVLTAHEKSGKTTFACTSPDPIAFIVTDAGSKQIIRKFPHKDILIAEHSIQRDADQAEWKEEWRKMKNSILSAATSPHIKTIVADTGTEVYELLRLAEFGKLDKVLPSKYATTNKEMRDLLKICMQREDLNFVWIHKFKKEYIDKGDKGVANWTGKYESAGFGDARFILDMAAVSYFHDPTRDEAGYFSMQVVGATRQTAQAAGLVLKSDDEMLPLCFGSLAWSVYPETDLDDWLTLAGPPDGA